MIVAVEQLKAELTDQPKMPLRPSQISEYHGELERLGVMVEGRDQDGIPRDWLKGASGTARRRAMQVSKVLADQSPKRVTGERASRIHRLSTAVLTEVIQPALLPRSSMRRNPPGSVGHVMRTEFDPVFKDAVLTVKRALWALDPDNRDPDYTSMERFRREGTGEETATFMAGAQIPGVLAFGRTAKANWPLGEPTADTALKQAQRQNGETTMAPVKKSKKTRIRRPVTQAQLDMLARGRATRAANLAAKGGAA